MMQDFQQEAMDMLSQTSPELVNYVCRFSDLTDKLPENTNVKVGVYLLHLPSGFFLIPVIARGEIVYPLDSLYDMATNLFRPLTGDILSSLVAMQGTRMGQPTRIPTYVNINPSVYNMIVPPRTGKYSYASSRLDEAMAMAPGHVIDRFYNTLLDNKAMAQELAKFIDVQSLFNSRLVPESEQSRAHTVMVSQPSVEIITGHTGMSNLDPLVIKDILDCGYHVRGDVLEPRQAVEQVSGLEGYLQLKGAIQGMAYRAALGDGSNVNGMVLKRAPRISGIDLPDRRARPNAGFYTADGHADRGEPCNLFVSEYGGWTDDGHAVLSVTPVQLSDVSNELYGQGLVRDMTSLSNKDVFIILTGKGALGPFQADNVAHTGDMVTIRASEPYPSQFYRGMTKGGSLVITASTGFSGDYFVEPGRLLVNPNKSVIVLPRTISDSIETNINSAQRRLELKTLGTLKDSVEIRSHDHGFFSIGGRMLSEPELVEKLIIGEGIGKQACMGFLKSARVNGKVVVFMAKKADDMGATPVGEIPEYGQMPPQEENSMFNMNAIQGAVDTGYPDVVETTVLSQILLDPSMYSTISTYLPSIDQCIDRLGRTLFSLRLEGTEGAPDNLPNLIATLRGTYRSLGDGALKLRNTVNAYISKDTDISRSRI